MLRGMATLGFVLLATSTGAADWEFEVGDIPIAYIDNEAAQLQFACRSGDLTIGFWVKRPTSAVAGATSLSVAMTPDPAEGAAASAVSTTRFAQDMPLIQTDGSSTIVRGPVARQWAQLARSADKTIAVAFVQTRQNGRRDLEDAQLFSAKRSSAAIGRALARCG